MSRTGTIPLLQNTAHANELQILLLYKKKNQPFLRQFCEAIDPTMQTIIEV